MDSIWSSLECQVWRGPSIRFGTTPSFTAVHYYYTSLTPALDVLDICSFLLFS